MDAVDLSVRRGEVFGVLGPNGAGKTTMLKMLATLLPIDAGEATILGVDVRREPHVVRQLLGVTGQYASVDELLTATENLVLFARLQGIGRAEARRTADRLLEQFDLTEAASKPIKHFSGGMRRRLDLAASLITRPPLIFLDEPTTGLDPRTRGQMWETIRELIREGSTVLLTTQYLDEADQLADRIQVIDRGRTVALGTPDELKSSIGGSSLQVQLVERGRPRAGRRHRAAAARRAGRPEPRGPPPHGRPDPQRPGRRRAPRPARGRHRHRVGRRGQALPRRGVPGPHRPRHPRRTTHQTHEERSDDHSGIRSSRRPRRHRRDARATSAWPTPSSRR